MFWLRDFSINNDILFYFKNKYLYLLMAGAKIDDGLVWKDEKREGD